MQWEAAWALGGVALTGGLALWGSVLANGWRYEERQEARREALAALRRSAYVEFLVSASRLLNGVQSWMDETGRQVPATNRIQRFAVDVAELSNAFDACERKARILADKPVDDALVAYRNWFREATGQALVDAQPGYSVWEKQEQQLLMVMTSALTR